MLDKFKIGHYSDQDNGTGVTVIISEEGAVGGVSVRGSSPATRETELLRSEKTVQKVNAVVLSGGSAFGLEASCGVMDYLAENGFGYAVGDIRVPIVVGASVYDLAYKNNAYPHKQDGYKAAENATKNNFDGGIIGGACGATISKLLGMETAVKTSLGVQTLKLNGLEMAVITVVNALGDIVKDGRIIAGAKMEDDTFLDSQKVLSLGSLQLKNTNTTIGCILTNARLTKVEANYLADLAHDGLARAISPSHTRFDGDAFFCLSSGEKDVDINVLSSLVPTLTEKSIQSSVEKGEAISKKVNRILFKVLNSMLK